MEDIILKHSMRLTIRRSIYSTIVSIVFVFIINICFFLENSFAANGYSASILGVQEYSTPVEARDFVLKDVNRKSIRLQDFRGKVVMLNFWATWCAPCRLEMPSMEKLHQQFKDQGLVILAVASGEKMENVSTFVKKYNITFPTLLDPDQKIADDYNVWALPTTYFINGEGKIIGRVNGSREWDDKAAIQYIKSIFQASL